VHTSLTLLMHALVVGAATTTKSKGGSSELPFLIILVIFALVYIGFLRPARKRQMAAVATKRSVEVGDEVTTTAGLIATVVAVTDDVLTLEVAPGVHCRYVPAAILRVNVEDEPDVETSTEIEPDTSNHEVIEDPTGSEGTTDKPDEAAPA